MTEDEEALEIIRRLSTHPIRKTVYNDNDTDIFSMYPVIFAKYSMLDIDKIFPQDKINANKLYGTIK